MKKKATTILLATIAIILVVIATRLVYQQVQYHNKPCDYEQMAQRGVLNVAVNYSPLSYHIEGDSISGFDYELLQLLAERAQLKINFHPEASYSKSLELLDNRTYDFIAQPIPITTRNKQDYIFSKPLQLNKQVLIQRTDSAGNKCINSQLDLGGCTLHIAQDAPTRMRIENLAQEIGDTIHICEMPHYGAEQLIILVATGEIEYAVCDVANAAIFAADYPCIDYSTDISFTQLMSWTLRKESVVLCDSIDSWLSQIQQTDAYREIYTRYFGSRAYHKHQRIQ